jgi:SAM-dependent methyltransferase
MTFNMPKDLSRWLNIRSRVRAVEEWWFDATRHVLTSGNASPDARKIVGGMRDSQIYVPVRVANAHAALRDLPPKPHSEYTFFDVGSGKGRVLFVAAEYPFRKIRGVEFAGELHEQAQANISRYRHRRQRCVDIASIHADAAEFDFPNENLVLYLFNPFGPEVLGRMLAKLEQSIERHPRHVIVVLLWPENSEMVAKMRWMREYRRTRRYHIYQTEMPFCLKTGAV